MRVVISHYHIFKNSGTSFDSLLAENFGDRHVSFDGPFPFFTIDQEQFSRIIERRPEAVAFSSHQIVLPVPVSLKFHVLPVVFIRHPLLRVLSIYSFKKQYIDGTKTSENAQNRSFDDWISSCFSDRQEITHISNAQTRILGAAYRQKTLMERNSSGMKYDLGQAIRNLENVSMIARTEHFNHDVERFADILSGYGIEFNYKEVEPQNVTSTNQHKSISERLEDARGMLSEENYNKLMAANGQDLSLYERVENMID